MTVAYEWKLYRMVTWKFVFDGKGIKLLIGEDLNLLSDVIMRGKGGRGWGVGVGGMRIFGVGSHSSPMPKVSHKDSGEGRQLTPGKDKKPKSKERAYLIRRGIQEQYTKWWYQDVLPTGTYFGLRLWGHFRVYIKFLCLKLF